MFHARVVKKMAVLHCPGDFLASCVVICICLIECNLSDYASSNRRLESAFEYSWFSRDVIKN